MGWIFYKPIYERMDLIDREDLDGDPGAQCSQYRYACPLLILCVFDTYSGTLPAQTLR